MTTYYYDSVSGLDTNDGLTTSTPRQTYTSAGSVAGDTYYFRAGTTQSFPGMVTARTGTSDAVRTRYLVYDKMLAVVPYVTFQVMNTDLIIMNAAATKWCVFEDIKFDMRNLANHSLYAASQTASGQTTNNTIRRCIFTRSAANGLSITREGNSTSAGPTGYVIEDCQFYDNAAHGMIIIGGTNSFVRRCQFWNNGFNVLTGGHGFSARALFANNASLGTSSTLLGWTLHSGTIWKRTLVTPETDAYYVRNTLANPYHLTRAASATAPGSMEYGVSGGVLYLNVGSASSPAGQAVSYVYGLCSNLIIEDCEAWDTVSDPRVAGTEGHGFVFDDWADTGIFRRNKSYNNEGYGFSLNKGSGNQVIGNICYGNGGSGVLVNAATTAVVQNNTFVNNNQIPAHALAGEIKANYGSTNGVFTNNIIKGSVTYGVDTDPADAGHTGTKNNVYGCTNASRVAILTSTVTVDPLLDTDYRPLAASLIGAGANLGGRDFFDRQFYQAPNIGAIEDATDTPRFGLSG